MDSALEESAINKWRSLKNNAETREIEFSLSVADVRQLIIKKKCFYTGKSIVRGANGTFSIDRVDNSLGYVKGNVVACHTVVNQFKANLSLSDIKAIARKL